MESVQTIRNGEFGGDDDVIKAQEKLNLRREARRRKILENAKNRLQKLDGRANANNSITATSSTLLNEHYIQNPVNGANFLECTEFSDPEVEPDIIPQQILQNNAPADFGNLLGFLSTESTLTQQKRHILIRVRLHLIISALISCIFTLYLSESGISSLSVFIPVGLCAIIDLMLFRESQTLNPVVNLLITMCNIRLPSQTKNILYLFSIIQSLIFDLGVFTFSFCIFTSSLIHINNHYIDLIVIK